MITVIVKSEVSRCNIKKRMTKSTNNQSATTTTTITTTTITTTTTTTTTKSISVVTYLWVHIIITNWNAAQIGKRGEKIGIGVA